MRVFLCLSDVQLVLALCGEVLTQRVLHVLLVEQDVHALEAGVIRRHAEILQTGDRVHTCLRHILLCQNDCQLLRTVVAVVEEDHHVALFDDSYRLAILHMDDRFDELVCHALCVRLLHGLHHALGCLALALNQQVVSLFHTLPTFVAIHRIVTTNDRSDLTAGCLQVVGQCLDKALSALRIRVTTIHEAMYEALLHAILLGDVSQLQQMLQRAVHATVRHQTHQVDLLAVLLRIAIRPFDLRILQDRVLATSDVDLHQVLVNDTTCADIQVTYLRVTHLAIRQTYVLARSLQLRVRISFQQRIPIGSRRARDYIILGLVANTPTITDN